MPLGDFDDDQSTVAAGGQDEPMPSSSARQSLQERRQENDAENYEFGQWDEYEANDFGYAFTYEGNVPVSEAGPREHKTFSGGGHPEEEIHAREDEKGGETSHGGLGFRQTATDAGPGAGRAHPHLRLHRGVRPVPGISPPPHKTL